MRPRALLSMRMLGLPPQLRSERSERLEGRALRAAMRGARRVAAVRLLDQALCLHRFLHLGTRGDAIDIGLQVRPLGQIEFDARHTIAAL